MEIQCKPLDGNEIAEELNITPQAVSWSLKRSLRKIYKRLKVQNRLLGPLDIACLMLAMFNLKCGSDINRFWNLLPQDVQREIHKDADIRAGTIKY